MVESSINKNPARKSIALSKPSFGKYMNLKDWKDCREYMVWIKTVTKESAKMYERCFRYFVEFSQNTETPINTLRDLITINKDELNMLLEDYLVSISDRKHGTVRLYLAAIESFLKYYEVPYSDRRISKLLPEKLKLAGAEAYDVETIQKMYDSANNLRAKMLVLLLASSAMRRGGIAELRMGNIIPIEDCYLFIVHANHSKEYVTFCTPECRIAIVNYIEYRKERGEEITDDSPLYQTRGEDKSNDTRYMISSTIENLLKTAKIKRKKIGDRYTVSEVHGFRKFANTQMNNANINANTIEKFMGHGDGMNVRYYDGRSKELFEHYKKAIPYLTILKENRQELIIKDLKNRSVVDEVATTKKMDEMEQTIKELKEKMEDIEQEKESKERLVVLYENDVIEKRLNLYENGV